MFRLGDGVEEATLSLREGFEGGVSAEGMENGDALILRPAEAVDDALLPLRDRLDPGEDSGDAVNSGALTLEVAVDVVGDALLFSRAISFTMAPSAGVSVGIVNAAALIFHRVDDAADEALLFLRDGLPDVLCGENSLGMVKGAALTFQREDEAVEEAVLLFRECDASEAVFGITKAGALMLNGVFDDAVEARLFFRECVETGESLFSWEALARLRDGDGEGVLKTGACALSLGLDSVIPSGAPCS